MVIAVPATLTGDGGAVYVQARNADGTPTAQHADKMAELERLTGKIPEPKKPARRRARVKK